MKRLKFNIKILWDIIMVIVVLGNLTLIAFDMTYLWLRPFYYKHFPQVLSYYDKPILGIEPHRSTEKYLRYIDTIDYLEKLQSREFYDQEFADQLIKVKNLIASIQSKGDQRLLELKSEITSDLETVTTPDQISTVTLDRIEDYLDFLPQIDNKKTIQELAEASQNLDLLIRVQSERGRIAEHEDLLSKMDYQIIHLVETNPFQDSGQTENLSTIKDFYKSRYSLAKTRELDREYRAILLKSLGGQKSFPSTALSASWYWRNPAKSFQEKYKEFNQTIRPLFEMNYYRSLAKDGEPINNFIWLDAPFLLFFLFEFAFSWYWSIRNKTFMAWFFYPIYHWYDILGLIPFVEFRIFRLIRIYKIFLILKTNKIVPVGNDIISRTIRYYSNILKEELSDMVTIQILTEAQEEIRSGASLQIVTHALDTHRDQIKSVVIHKLRNSIDNPRLSDLFSQILTNIINKGNIGSPLANILPESIKLKFSKGMGDIAYSTFSMPVKILLEDEQGVKSIEALVDFILDEFLESSHDFDVNQLNTAVTIELLENVKKTVAQKKWLDSNI
ncbi:hypothetical protein [Leptospira sp. GIMC2001]|uniref:hypothetical protein n=1 Tax=Leptospira sp. GIMC2001 TaxID=1513297 RepID=UPI00234A9A13|nr:hypothetical protein [Leptospira sp. GIMC2001]WCL47546.1 hypothetical protein O4O04_00850 [Leptospira sp. GIMC2001]